MKKYILLFGIFCLGLINYSFADFFVETILDDSHNSFTLSGTGLLLPIQFQTWGSSCYLDIYNSNLDLVEKLEIFDYGYFDTLNSNGDIGLVYLPAGNYTYNFLESDCDPFQVYVIVSSGSSEIDCPVCESTFSTLFVDGTQITGANNIYISLPDYFEYTPTYYTGYMDLIVENVGNPEYIEGIINMQTTQPNETDFNNIIQVLLPLFVPGFIIILFVIFVFRLIKKIF